ncbi:MAG: HAD family hydrolase [Anaerolineae bacterium]|nr:HAD family hydrolase [Anaerolineae bacterium]
MGEQPLRAVFFDLDDTLTVYPGGFEALLEAVYRRAQRRGARAEDYRTFVRAFWNSTCGLWAAMHAGRITGEEVRLARLRRGLAAIGIDDLALATEMREEWDRQVVDGTRLRDGAAELLQWLRGRVYLGLITDGYRTIQRRKLERLGVERLFDRVQISEEERACKPFATAFRRSLDAAGVAPGEAAMIGDNANADVRGALGVGMRAVHLAPQGPVRTPKGALWAGDMDEVWEILASWIEDGRSDSWELP